MDNNFIDVVEDLHSLMNEDNAFFTDLIDIDDLNSPDDEGNVALHTAAIQDRFTNISHETRQFALKSCVLATWICWNISDTPLLLSLTLQRSSDFIAHLVKAGCDINVCNNHGITPLHRAIALPTVEFSQLLLKRGANINAQDADGRTALHFAIKNNHIEAVCMLLYYGADVNIACIRNFVPFTYALYVRKWHIADVLFDYYDDFSYTNIYGYTALHLAAWRRSSLAVSILKAGVDVNRITAYGESALVFSLEYNSAELFKMIWSQLDYEILLNSQKPFLWSYVQVRQFSTCEWLECIYLLLTWPVAPRLIEHCNNYIDFDIHQFRFFENLLRSFDLLQVKHDDRMAIINICLSLSCEVHIQDINYAILFSGFNDEVEAFIYATNRSIKFGDDPYIHFPLLSFILGTCEDPEIGAIISVYIKHVNFMYNLCNLNKVQKVLLINLLRFFSIPHHQKQELLKYLQLSPEDYEDVSRVLEALPDIPSLIELSHNQVRRYVRSCYQIDKPYQFHTAVNALNLPQHIKDVNRFKTPLYL